MEVEKNVMRSMYTRVFTAYFPSLIMTCTDFLYRLHNFLFIDIIVPAFLGITKQQKSLQVLSVIVVGLATNTCVEATAGYAVEMSYHTSF